MSSARHPNKEIRAAVEHALASGWRLVEPGGSAHAWGFLRCPGRTRGACTVPVHSTPRVPEDEARRIRRRVGACPHTGPP